MGGYERALETLYQASLGEFTALRNRLAAEMRARGDRPSAGRLSARRRPTLSAWTVNQLYWRARREFDALHDAAERLRAGDLDAMADYRQALAALRRRAADVLKEAGHAANDAVLGRVANTLAAIAAVGFEPDAPGTLAADRDPPGFDIGLLASPRPASRLSRVGGHGTTRRTEPTRDRAPVVKERRVAQLAEKRREVERARQARERDRLEREVAAARAEIERREKALARTRGELHDAEQALARAQAHLQQLEGALTRLEAS